ncbi:MAG: cobalamin-dependent protein [Dehalococcoidales bacterium]|nr:cobalamin-dependent protein [Dehalococcoidales bacterium]
MSSLERSQALIADLYNAVVNMDDEGVVRTCHVILEEGIDANEAVTKGLTAAMQKVGELYNNYEYFVPELLLCSDALYAGLDILKPHIIIDKTSSEIKKQIILGVVEGDIHNIGKNLVKIMFDAAGWIVHDLGHDEKLERFVDEQHRTKADVVGISALMTTSMLAMPRLVNYPPASWGASGAQDQSNICNWEAFSS